MAGHAAHSARLRRHYERGLEELAVDYIVEGSVRTEAGQTRIAVRLVEGYALERQAFTTALYVSEFLARRLTPKDFYGDPAAKRVQYEFAMRGVVGKAQILRVTVWSSVGRVLYSDDRKLIGLAFPPSAPLRAALSGQVRSVIVHAKRRTPALPSQAAGSSESVTSHQAPSPQIAASSPASRCPSGSSRTDGCCSRTTR